MFLLRRLDGATTRTAFAFFLFFARGKGTRRWAAMFLHLHGVDIFWSKFGECISTVLGYCKLYIGIDLLDGKDY